MTMRKSTTCQKLTLRYKNGSELFIVIRDFSHDKYDVLIFDPVAKLLICDSNWTQISI